MGAAACGQDVGLDLDPGGAQAAKTLPCDARIGIGQAADHYAPTPEAIMASAQGEVLP